MARDGTAGGRTTPLVTPPRDGTTGGASNPTVTGRIAVHGGAAGATVAGRGVATPSTPSPLGTAPLATTPPPLTAPLATALLVAEASGPSGTLLTRPLMAAVGGGSAFGSALGAAHARASGRFRMGELSSSSSTQPLRMGDGLARVGVGVRARVRARARARARVSTCCTACSLRASWACCGRGCSPHWPRSSRGNGARPGSLQRG